MGLFICYNIEEVMKMTEETYLLLVQDVKNQMGILYDDDDEVIKRKGKSAVDWFLNSILYEPEYVIEPDTQEYSLMVERVRYDLSNSLDVFQRNYGNDIQNVISKHAILDYRKNHANKE